MTSAPARGALARVVNVVKANEKLHVAWCVTGIVGCLLLYGVLQVCPFLEALRRFILRELAL